MHIQTKQLLKEAFFSLGTLVYNLLYFAKRSQDDNDLASLRNLVLSLPREVKDKYIEECTFVESLLVEDIPSIMFPYPIVGSKVFDKVYSGMEKGFPYVLHNGKEKLFFSRHITLADAERFYTELVSREGLLGTGCLAKSPHCYQSGDFKVEDGDILLDIGCAEAIFTLDNIAKVSKAYLFESLSMWRKPLQLTFAPFGDKVVLVNKLVSDRTHRNSITLMDVVNKDISNRSHFFVKMDIEGWERIVVRGNADFFKTAHVKLSCCVYHRQDDAQVIDKMLKEMGYRTWFSDGYMLPTMNGLHYPYFRHGVIYAQNY